MPIDIEWYQEAERRGLLDRLSKEQQDWWAEAKRRGLSGEQSKQSIEEESTPNTTQPTTEENITAAGIRQRISNNGTLEECLARIKNMIRPGD